ncbi:MAG: CHAT domain-containing protein [Chloroflexi bacterium]|nr:CHAT domain-containing protein [Chloroflexota bacterium]
MCDQLKSVIEHCEPLIRQGRFDELDKMLQEYEPHIAHCAPCRHQHTFYRAVRAGMHQRDYVLAQSLLVALIESNQVDAMLRARATNLSAMFAEFQGQYSEALGLHQRAFDACVTADDVNGQARALCNQAIILNNYLHTHERALALLDQAEKLLEQTGNQVDMVRVWNERGLCLMYLERWAEARKALETSQALCIEQDNAYLRAICETNLGSWERLQGHWDKAKKWYTPLFSFFEQPQFANPLLQSEVLFYLSQVCQAQGQLDQAEAYLDDVLRLAKENHSDHFIALAHLGRARLAVRRKDHHQALALYWQAARAVEQIRSAQGVQDVRLDFQTQWNALYREAAAYALQLERVEDSLKFSEHARMRLLLDTLGTPPNTARPDAPPELLDELEQLQIALHQSYAQQIAGKLDETGQTDLQARETHISQVRTILHRYDQENLPYQSPPELEEIQRKLPQDAVILSYFGMDSDLVVFAIDKEQVRHRLLSVSPAQLKTRLDQGGLVRGIMPDTYTRRLSPHVKILYLLYNGLLAPITDWLSDYASIYLAPDADLRHIPFHLLAPGSDQPCPLTQDNRRLTYLPSASVLTRLPSLQTKGEFLAIGYNGSNLMLTETHAQQIAQQNNGQSLCGPAAKREPVMHGMNDCAQIYFAGHNVFRTPAPVDCGLLMAPNRLLTLLDIQRLRLSGNRVVLGACQSSLAVERGGDWLGLTNALLQAGAAQVMGTLWPVSEVAMCLLMDRFWEALTDNNDPLPALRHAQAEIRSLTLDDIRQAFTVYELPPQAQDYVENQLTAIQNALPGAPHPLDHPYYWAPFIIVGV